MKLIPLTQGQFAMVDDEDYEYLIQWKWQTRKGCNTFYAERAFWNGKNNSKISMHREIMKTPKELQVDHINHNGIDNQKNNLRNCTRSQNQMNTLPSGKSKYKGVYWCENTIKRILKNGQEKIYKIKPKWKAQIMISGKKTSLGYFENEIDAAKAYNEAAVKYHKEFSHLNII